MIKNDIGFYTVGEKKFSSKLEAVLEAQLTDAKVEWNFFDDIFSKVDWTIEPELSLDQFYKIRAQQIRDAYDYVIVFCSGGADSTNVIKSFINNGIKVDEVIGIAPMSGLKNWEYNPNNIADLNIISETKFALLPLLDQLSTHGMKVTLYDPFEEMVKYKDEEWAVEGAGNIVTVLTQHFTKVSGIPHIDKIIQSGKKVGLVYGTDKPIIKITPDGNIVFVLADSGINYLTMPDSRATPNVDRVLFYWTPELPLMLVKQAHVVSRVVQLPEFADIYQNCVLFSDQDRKTSSLTFQDTLNYYQQNNLVAPVKEDILKKHIHLKNTYTATAAKSYRSIYQREIVPYIYPSTYTKNLWQAQKVDVSEGFFTRDQDWVHILHQGTNISQMILSGAKLLHSSIKPKYLNYKGTGFNFINKVYKIGNTKQYKII